MNKGDSSLSLKEICKEVRHGNISLPTVQRGFVWKPNQIENLWDSLLRGFPVGAFVFSTNNDKFELLDGQQRATSILLGFYDASSEDIDNGYDALKSSTDKMRLFIDLKKPEDNKRKYVFRVLTKSHPWGYQRGQNEKVLTSDKIRQAQEIYNLVNNNPYATPIDEFWPMDAGFAIPFGIFLNDDNLQSVEIKVKMWLKKTKRPADIPNGDEYYDITHIHDKVLNMLKKQTIPCLYFEDDDYYKDDNLGYEQSDDEEIDEIENLFIRLNAGGTPLRGEELNYSILKANIHSELQIQIEEQCSGFIRPSRFITIAFRLFQNNPKTQDKEATDTITLRIKPKQFQNTMKNNKKEFIEFLENILNQQFLDKVISTLSYDPIDNLFGLPKFMTANLADKAPEVILMFMYRLLFIDRYFNEETKRRMLGIVTLFTWFGKGEYNRDHSKLISHIWSMVKKNNDTNIFWSKELIKKALIRHEHDADVLIKFPKFKQIKALYNSVNTETNIQSLLKEKVLYNNGADIGVFLKKIFSEEGLLLYAQRDALYMWFEKYQSFELEDTTRPFDWDHISPNALVHYMKNIHDALRSWYQTNGNLRAWPYMLNRHDQKDVPSRKIKKISLNEFSEMCDSIGCNKDEFNPDILFIWSKCSLTWRNIDFDTKDLQDNGKAKILLMEIFKRNIDICKIWYNDLKINDLYVSDCELSI